MAIADVPSYLHLSSADVEEIAYELDAIRQDVEDSLGAKDAAYIRRVIHFQRALDVAARLVIAGSRSKKGRSEEHTSELQSLMRISYAVFCLKKKTMNKIAQNSTNTHTKSRLYSST